MESVKCRPGDERRLVGDPEVLHRIVRIHKENTLFGKPMLAKAILRS